MRHRSVQPRAGAIRRSRRAFTVIEVVLAVAMSSLVVIGALAIMGMLWRADKRLDRRFEQSIELAMAQGIVRRAMYSLVSAPPLPAELEEEDADIEPDKESDLDTEGLTEEEIEELELAAIEAEEAELERSGGKKEKDDEEKESYWDRLNRYMKLGPPHFSLSFEEYSGGIVLPRLEVVVLESPVPRRPYTDDELEDRRRLRREMLEDAGDDERSLELAFDFLRRSSSGPIRGVFEMVLLEDQRWALQWSPLDPPGEPFVLVRGVTQCEWWVLPQRKIQGMPGAPGTEHVDWTDFPVPAYIVDDYPVAVRLVLWTDQHAHVDWMFETTIVAGE